MNNSNECSKKKKTPSLLGYVAGSAVLFAVSSTVIPAVMPKLSGSLNKYMTKMSNAKKSGNKN